MVVGRTTDDDRQLQPKEVKWLVIAGWMGHEQRQRAPGQPDDRRLNLPFLVNGLSLSGIVCATQQEAMGEARGL